MKGSTVDYREISVLDDATLRELATIYLLISQKSDILDIKAELAAIKIFAAFTWGLKRWEDALLERSRLAAHVQSGGDQRRSVEEGHEGLAKIVEGLREEDPLLAKILGECVKIGRGG